MATKRPSTNSDTEIILASINDSNEFGELFSRHANSVFRFLTYLTNRNTAEDLLGETFIVAFSARSRFDATHQDARPWLFGIAANVARHHRRKESRRTFATLKLRSDPNTTTFALDHATDKISALESFKKVEVALASIPEQFRSALLLFGAMDLTYEETARALGVPIGTVRSRIARGRSKLRELLGDLVDEHDLDFEFTETTHGSTA